MIQVQLIRVIMANNKFRLEIEIDRESNEITLSSVKFPPELQEELRSVCEKYYRKHNS